MRAKSQGQQIPVYLPVVDYFRNGDRKKSILPISRDKDGIRFTPFKGEIANTCLTYYNTQVAVLNHLAAPRQQSGSFIVQL